MQVHGAALRAVTLAGVSAVLCAGVIACGGSASASSTTKGAPVKPPPGCARRAPGPPSPPQWAPAHVKLAPSGAGALRLCRYAGLNTIPALHLIRSRLVTSRSRIRTLVRQLDALPPFPPGAYSCPVDDGAAIVAKLAYPGRHRVTIDVALSGCRAVTNGSLRRTAFGVGSTSEAHVIAVLEGLVPGS